MKMASFIPCLSVSKTSHKINEHHFNIVFIINKKGLKIRYFFASQECDWKILLLHQLCHRKKLNFCCLLSEGILSILSGTTQMINISDETYFFLLQSSLFIISMILFLVWCWCQWWFSLSLLLVAESRFPTTTAPLLQLQIFNTIEQTGGRGELYSTIIISRYYCYQFIRDQTLKQ